jgi:hypothetical protein
MKGRGLPILFAGILAVQGCADGIPTSEDGGLVPVESTTVELRLPFSQFATDFQLFGGYGTTARLPDAIIANDWGGTVDSRALMRFSALPNQIFVRPPEGGATVPDSLFVPVSAEMIVGFDTTTVFGEGPFTIGAYSVQEVWDLQTATWEFSSDSSGVQTPWSVPGGGALAPVAEVEWDRFDFAEPEPDEDGEIGDDPDVVGTIAIPVDSATVDHILDRQRPERGLLITTETPESRLRILGGNLVVQARSSVNPDTLVAIPVDIADLTFIYTPRPDLDPEAFPIGGSPGMRATMRFDLPESVNLSPEECERVGCPLQLDPDRLVYAGLELHTRESQPFGLRILRPTVIELRPVLSPNRLPRSPLAFPVACPTGACPMLLPPTIVQEEDFGTGANRLVDLPVTRYLRDLLRDPALVETPVPSTLALMFGLDAQTGLEMRAMQHATFWGPGTEFEPTLRLILTISDGIPAP